jgi:4-amino-4-deoxy-L-arabinose transferase-like glycosyltransferase
MGIANLINQRMKSDLFNNIFFQLFCLFAIIWTGLVSFYYFNPAFHEAYPRLFTTLKAFLLPPILLSFLFLLSINFVNKIIAKNKFIKLNLFKILALFISSVFILILTASLDRQIITLIDLPIAIFSLGQKIIPAFLFLVLLTSIFYLCGKTILDLFKLKTKKFSQILFSLALGYIFYSSGLVFLSLVNFLNIVGLLILVLIMFFLGRKNVDELKKYAIFKLTINNKININSINLWFSWLLFLSLALALAILTQPMPSGFDSVTYYFNLSKELALTGSFVRGQYSFPIEAVHSSGYLLAQFIGLPSLSEIFASFLSWWGGLFSVAIIIILGKKIHSYQTGLLAALVYYTMPIIGFYNSVEPKSEVTQAAFLSLALLALIKWKQEPKNKWAFLIFLFLAFAFTIKITAVFAAVAFIGVIIFEIIRNKLKDKIIFVNIAKAGLISFSILILPWFSIHLFEQNRSLADNIRTTLSGQVYENFLLGKNPTEMERIKFITKQSYGFKNYSSGFSEDYSRYMGNETGWWGLEKYLPEKLAQIPMARYLSLPWDLTVLVNRNTINFMISSLFLILIPIFITLKIFFKKEHQKLKIPLKLRTISSLTLIYFLAWLIWGRGIIWYGIGLLICFSIIISVYFLRLKKVYPKNFVSKLLVFLFFFNVLFSITIQTGRFGHPAVLAFTTGKISKSESIEQMVPGYLRIAGVINSDPDIQSGEKFVLLVGSYLHYFIDNYYQNVLEDQYLDHFGTLYLSSEEDDQKTLQLLKKMGVKYIVFDLGTKLIDTTDNKTLVAKQEIFMQFATKNLTLRDISRERGLLLLEVR